MALAIRQFDDIIPQFADDLQVELRRCPRCERNLPKSEFGICRARKDGLNLYCKRCIREKINLSRQAFRQYKKTQLQRIASLPRPQLARVIRTYSEEIQSRMSRHTRKALRAGSSSDRVLAAIQKGFHTQKEIASATKLPKDEICDVVANLLLWTKEIRTKVVRGQRMYFINEEHPSYSDAPASKKSSPEINDSFSSIGILMPGGKPANQRRKTA